jgi:ATP-dependent RNA helicase SUPV3L1/SUV3
LRKYGVRFGAYHVYVPALLKPAPRGLALLLWALKKDVSDFAALGTAQHLASSGRTSFPIDKELDRDAYRVLGYRVCGERAVRVDILERLADLIRPALAWRTGSAAIKPDGAFDGSAFTVTQAMTSLTGSAGEDFASILRALGYRMDKRPKPPEPIVAAIAETPAVDQPPADDAGDVNGVTEPAADAGSSGAATDADSAAATEASAVAEPVGAEPAIAEAAIAEVPPVAAAGDGADESSPTDTASAVVAAEATADAVSLGEVLANEVLANEVLANEVLVDSVAEPELIEVWRPGRHEERRPRREHHHRPARSEAPSGEASEAQGDREGGRKSGGWRRGKGRDEAPRDKGPREGQRRDQAPRTDAAAAEGEMRGGARRDGGKESRDQHRDRPRHRDRDRDRFARKGGGEDRLVASSAPRERRDKVADPNSPFAKLAALKAQLEAGGKDSS